MLQVFIHDPLYKWAMTPYDVQYRQHGDQEAHLLDGPSEKDARPLNADAERALLRVQQKLKGIEGGIIQFPYSHPNAMRLQMVTLSQICLATLEFSLQ